jgi:serine/threonine protein kinase
MERAARGLRCAFGMRVVHTMPMRLGPYLLTECIGVGGMAAVYRGKRRSTAGFETQVVVKTLLPEHRKNQRYVRLFKEEARLSAQLRHNNVVRVHDFGMLADTPFLEMEDLSGWNLQQVWNALAQRKERLPLPIALTLVTEACRGLAYAHAFVDDKGARRPIIHRDVSPANVMICRDGSIKLVDFGLARLTSGETQKIDTFLGKIAYMSPEQLDRRELDRRADVFALGVTLHELLTGQRLFGIGNDHQTLVRLQTLVVEPPSTVNPDVPAALDVIVLRAIQRDPNQRYQSAAEMLAALDALGAVTASRTQLLSYLGTMAPDVFTHACDECGAKIAWGASCVSCKTRLDPALFAEEDAAEPPPVSATASPRTATLPIRWLSRRWLLLRLTLCVLWRTFDSWIADQRIRALERAARR